MTVALSSFFWLFESLEWTGSMMINDISVCSAWSVILSFHVWTTDALSAGHWCVCCVAGKLITAAYVPLPNYHALFPDSAQAATLVMPSSARTQTAAQSFVMSAWSRADLTLMWLVLADLDSRVIGRTSDNCLEVSLCSVHGSSMFSWLTVLMALLYVPLLYVLLSECTVVNSGLSSAHYLWNIINPLTPTVAIRIQL